jgi:hypothetical protein
MQYCTGDIRNMHNLDFKLQVYETHGQEGHVLFEVGF